MGHSASCHGAGPIQLFTLIEALGCIFAEKGAFLPDMPFLLNLPFERTWFSVFGVLEMVRAKPALCSARASGRFRATGVMAMCKSARRVAFSRTAWT